MGQSNIREAEALHDGRLWKQDDCNWEIGFHALLSTQSLRQMDKTLKIPKF